MITGITVPANNRVQGTVMDEVPRHGRQRALMRDVTPEESLP